MTTNDELRQMREAYANDDVGVVDYISFLEAHAAAGQQRIDELTAALEPFARTWQAYREYASCVVEHSVTGESFQEWLAYGDDEAMSAHHQRAHEALRGKGAEAE